MSTPRPAPGLTAPRCDDRQALTANHPPSRIGDDDPFTMRRPNPARMYDYLLRGKDNYAVDREAIDRFRAVFPEADAAAWANRDFHQRAAKWMAQQGITQFVDIGCGLPTVHNTHDVVRTWPTSTALPSASRTQQLWDANLVTLRAQFLPDPIHDQPRSQMTRYALAARPLIGVC